MNAEKIPQIQNIYINKKQKQLMNIQNLIILKLKCAELICVYSKIQVITNVVSNSTYILAQSTFFLSLFGPNMLFNDRYAKQMFHYFRRSYHTWSNDVDRVIENGECSLLFNIQLDFASFGHTFNVIKIFVIFVGLKRHWKLWCMMPVNCFRAQVFFIRGTHIWSQFREFEISRENIMQFLYVS